MFYNYIPRTLSLGPLTIHVYGITVTLGILSGLLIASRLAPKKGIPSQSIYDFGLYATLAGLVFARLEYVLLNLRYFIDNPMKMAAVTDGGLSFHGAVLGGAVTALWFARKHSISFWSLADTAAPGIALGEAIGRIGCDIAGKPTNGGILALVIDGVTYHNVPLYTGLSSLIIFGILWLLRDRVHKGGLFWLFVIMYSVARFIVDFFRQSTMLGALSLTQLVSIILIMLGVAVFFSRRNSDMFTTHT